MKIITTTEWQARPPKFAPQPAGAPDKIIVHHTDGHAAGGASRAAACDYARSIQNYHMDHNGWSDSGHNFLVTRSGFVLEGRHGSISAITKGKMIVSAHCLGGVKGRPAQNDQPGIEHEHLPGEKMTQGQQDASAQLCAWICKHTRIKPAAIYPHNYFFATDCPDNLVTWIPELSKDVAALLDAAPSDHAAELLWRLWAFGEGAFAAYGPFEGPRPNVINPAPNEWLIRAIKFLKRREKA